MKKLAVTVLFAGCLLGFAGGVSGQRANVAKISPDKTATFPDRIVLEMSGRALTEGEGVFLDWTTRGERGILGFYLYREGKGAAEAVPDGFVPGGYLQSRAPVEHNGDYRFFDPEGGDGSVYRIDAVGIDGVTRYSLRLIPNPVPDLSPFAGKSSEALRAEALQKKSAFESRFAELPGDLAKQSGLAVLPPDPETQRWVAAQPGVKIGVAESGIYRVSRQALIAAGLDANAQWDRLQLYTDGREQSIIVGPSDAYIEFFGEGMDTLESGVRTYFLVVGSTAGKRMETRTLRTIAGTVQQTGYDQTFVRRERALYLSGIVNGPQENFFASTPISGTGSSPVSYTLNLTGINTASPTALLTVTLQGMTINPHQVQVTFNGQIVGTMTWNGATRFTQSFEITSAGLLEGNNSLQFLGQGGSNSFTIFDEVRVGHSRKFESRQNQLGFYTVNYKAAVVTGFASANVRVFDVTDAANPISVANPDVRQGNGAFALHLPASRGRVYQAVEDSGLKNPVSIASNHPSTLSTQQAGAQMLIITHRDFLSEANAWATYRASMGTSAVVVDVADVFDEFSYGAVDTDRMNDFLEFARNNWQTPPAYLLIIGDASYDPRNYGNTAFQSFVPTELIDTLYEETGSDDALCDFNNDGLAELATGRIPARTGTEILQILAKTTQFESGAATAFNRGALFVADEPIGYDFEGVNNRLAQLLPAGWAKSFVRRNLPDQPQSRSLVLAELNQGKYLVNYSGHGSTLFWGASNFYHRNDIALMTNQNNYTMFTLLTCLNGYFVFPGFDSFAEAAIKAPNGGAVVAWASSGKTTPDIQEIMATRFYGQIALGNIQRMGDLVRDAKQVITGGRDVRLSWTLFGDPAVRVR